MALKIDSKIVGYKVLTEDDKKEPIESCNDAQIDDRESMHENLERPEMLFGSTYKIKTPLSEHALYVTINDVVLNQGTDHEIRQPYEVFINSKNMEHFAWTVALTRMISAVFRRGGDVSFVVEELKAVFDPRGGAWMQGRYVPSILAAIGIEGAAGLSLQKLLGWIMWPMAWGLGVPTEEASHVGRLLGEKLVLTELIAYLGLKSLLSGASPVLSAGRMKSTTSPVGSCV